MINRILEMLEEKKKEYLEAFRTHGDNERYGIACGFGDSIKIVQEVAKEYEEKKYYRITLSCLEDITNLEMPLTKQEYLFLTKLSDLVYRVATGCMPTMYVEQKGE